jgi:hypothetical protein
MSSTFHVQHLRGRADEDDARFLAGLGELGVLGQEPVAGMDGVGPVAAGDGHDPRDVQVGLQRIHRLVEGVGLVPLVAMEGGAVLLAEDAERADAELGAGAEHPDGDLAAVRYQHPFELARDHLCPRIASAAITPEAKGGRNMASAGLATRFVLQ